MSKYHRAAGSYASAFRAANAALAPALTHADPYVRHIARTMIDISAELDLEPTNVATHDALDFEDYDRDDYGAHEDIQYSEGWRSLDHSIRYNYIALQCVVYDRPSRTRCHREFANTGHLRGWAHRGGTERFPDVTGPTWDEVSAGFAR